MGRIWRATNRKNGSCEGFEQHVDRGWFQEIPKDLNKQCFVELVMKERGFMYPHQGDCVHADPELLWNAKAHSEPYPETSWQEERKTVTAGLPWTSAPSNGPHFPRSYGPQSSWLCFCYYIYIYNNSLLNLPTSSCFSITNPDHEGSSKSIWGLHATIQWGQLWFLWLLADPAPGVWEPSLNIWVALLWPPTPQSAQYHCLLLFNSH